MAGTQLVKPPEFAPGKGVSAALKRSVQAAISPTITYESTSPAELFKVPANTLIVDLIVVKTTAFDSSTAADDTLTIGDSDDADRYMAASDADIRNVGARSMKGAEGSDQVGSGGYLSTDAKPILATLGVGDDSNGAFYVVCNYVTFADEL